MEFRTKVALPAGNLKLSHHTKALFMGSCFAQRIGTKFRESALTSMVNPFGVLYNPESMALALECLLGEKKTDNYVFEGRDGLWHNWLFSSEFSSATNSALTESTAESMAEARKYLNGDVLCLTFGTVHAYRHRTHGYIVGNCHKEAGNNFEVIKLSVEHIVNRWKELLKKIFERSPRLQVIFTVSPYRYAGYGLHENTLSKATLHLAVAALQEAFPQCHYFPAYEIIIDELRDYRFYDADMLHPSGVAIEYIWERFADWCFSTETKEYIKDYQTILRDEQHRPLHPNSAEYAAFLAKAEERKRIFNERWLQ